MTPPNKSGGRRGPTLDYNKPLRVIVVHQSCEQTVERSTEQSNEFFAASNETDDNHLIARDIRVPRCSTVYSSVDSSVNLKSSSEPVIISSYKLNQDGEFYNSEDNKPVSLEEVADSVMSSSIITRITQDEFCRTAAYWQHTGFSITMSAKAFGRHGLFYSLRIEDVMFLLRLAVECLGPHLQWSRIIWLLTQGIHPRNQGKSRSDSSFARMSPGEGPQLVRKADRSGTKETSPSLIPDLLNMMTLPEIVEYKQNMGTTVTDEVFAFIINLCELLTGTRTELASEERCYVESTAYLGILTPSTSVFHKIYDYWRYRRFVTGRPLLRCFWPIPCVNDTSVFAVFRARTKERMLLRRPKRGAVATAVAGGATGNTNSTAKTIRERKEVSQKAATELFDKLDLRDTLKLRLCEVETCIFEQLLRESVDPTYILPTWQRLVAEIVAEMPSVAVVLKRKYPFRYNNYDSDNNSNIINNYSHSKKRPRLQNEQTQMFVSPVPLPPIYLGLPITTPETELRNRLKAVGVQDMVPVGHVERNSGPPEIRKLPIYRQSLESLPPTIRHPANLRLVVPAGNRGSLVENIPPLEIRSQLINRANLWYGQSRTIAIRRGRGGRLWIERR